MASEPIRLAAGYFAVEANDQRALLMGGASRQPDSVKLVIYSLLERKPRRFAEIMLASDLALHSGLLHERCPQPLLGQLLQYMQSSELTEPQRADAGRALGLLGDRRTGVARRDNPGKGVRPRKQPGEVEPFFAWSEEITPRTLTMGGDSHAWNGGHAVRRTIQRPYRIARYPVTNAQYDHFEKSDFFKVHAQERRWQERNRSDARFLSPNQPVVQVDWRHARGFCDWVNELKLSARELGLPESCTWEKWEVRLPSESEWELAARGPERRWLPWLDRKKAAPKADEQALRGKCNWGGSELAATSPVGIYPDGQSWCGAEDMIGNVWEWTRTEWRETPTVTGDADIVEVNGGVRRTLRGGSWFNDGPESLRCASRHGDDPGYSGISLGFRVAVVCLSACGG